MSGGYRCRPCSECHPRIEKLSGSIKEGTLEYASFSACRGTPSISRAEIANKLEISDSQAKTAIEKMKERRVIHREGSDTNGKWIMD